MNANRFFNLLTGAGVGFIGAGLVLTNCLFTVNGGERAILFDRFKGVLPKVYGEGFHFMVPAIQTPKFYEIRVKPRVFTTVTGTKDLQMVNVTLRILFRPNPAKIKEIFLQYGENYEERILPSLTNEVLKSVMAMYDALELLVEREQVSTRIKSTLATRAKDFNILIDDVAITELTFQEKFNEAIESKQIAQQKAER
eukprot:TRINITY_DN14847_c0_g1_i5.p1 TRINITY_DN14847_c0_g1~~TRINITY_DN14847_c0_g1_i5.p1  ORF type:complete len:197 (-),score=49.40 TRINITY_DN14847_c0_g1_i5:354-944(-)